MDPLFQPHPDGWYYLVARKISENMVPEVDTTGWDLWRYHPRTEVVEIHATGLRLPFPLTQDSWGKSLYHGRHRSPSFRDSMATNIPMRGLWMDELIQSLTSSLLIKSFGMKRLQKGFPQSRYETLPFGAIHHFEGISSGLVNATALSGSGTGAQSHLQQASSKRHDTPSYDGNSTCGCLLGDGKDPTRLGF